MINVRVVFSDEPNMSFKSKWNQKTQGHYSPALNALCKKYALIAKLENVIFWHI